MLKRSEIPLPKFHQETPDPSLSQILTDLRSSDKHAKGKALELLAIRLTHLLDLDFKGWLLRSAVSNSIEVGIVADERQGPFNRWLIQCRDARQMDMGDIATAVGRSVSFRPNVVLSVTSGHFTQQARYYVTKAMQLTNLHFVLIDVHDLKAIAADEAMIKSILGRETEQAKPVKELQLAPFYA
jgi:site-specific DNA-methyltransferase (cytosine-N4-specific)